MSVDPVAASVACFNFNGYVCGSSKYQFCESVRELYPGIPMLSGLCIVSIDGPDLLLFDLPV